MTRRLRSLAAAALVVALGLLASLGARDVVTRVVFPDHAVTFDPLGLLGGRLEASYIPTVIKSVQSATMDLNGVTSKTSTITAVTTANSALFYLGSTCSGCSALNGVSYIFARCTLTNTTTVTCVNGGAVGVTNLASWHLVEFRGGVVKSVQRGSVALATAASQTATITSVNTAKSFVNFLGLENNDTATAWQSGYMPKLVLTSATVVTATSGVANASSTTNNVGYQVVEFN